MLRSARGRHPSSEWGTRLHDDFDNLDVLGFRVVGAEFLRVLEVETALVDEGLQRLRVPLHQQNVIWARAIFEGRHEPHLIVMGDSDDARIVVPERLEFPDRESGCPAPFDDSRLDEVLTDVERMTAARVRQPLLRNEPPPDQDEERKAGERHDATNRGEVEHRVGLAE